MRDADRSLTCHLLGHRPRYWAQGDTLHWACVRRCSFAGSKRYPTVAQARRLARALAREDRESFGKRPLLSLLPLKLIERARRDGGAV